MLKLEPALDDGEREGTVTDSPPGGRPGSGRCSLQMSQTRVMNKLGGGMNEN